MPHRTQTQDPLFHALSEIWRREWRIRQPRGPILEHLREYYKLPRWHTWQEILLFGQTQSFGVLGSERLLGWLIGIYPGVVLLDTGETQILRPLTGLLRRVRNADPAIFMVQTFSSWTLGASLSISRSVDIEVSPRLFDCPVSITWEIRTETKEDIVEHLGIYPERWKMLERWLAHWLPLSHDT